MTLVLSHTVYNSETSAGERDRIDCRRINLINVGCVWVHLGAPWMEGLRHICMVNAPQWRHGFLGRAHLYIRNPSLPSSIRGIALEGPWALRAMQSALY